MCKVYWVSNLLIEHIIHNCSMIYLLLFLFTCECKNPGRCFLQININKNGAIKEVWSVQKIRKTRDSHLIVQGSYTYRFSIACVNQMDHTVP